MSRWKCSDLGHPDLVLKKILKNSVFGKTSKKLHLIYMYFIPNVRDCPWSAAYKLYTVFDLP